MRASLPVNVYLVPPSLDHKTGVSDLNVFAADLIDVGNPSLAFGIGLQLTAPTVTESAQGSQRRPVGLVNVLFVFSSKVFQYGSLLSGQESFAGSGNRDKVNFGAFQAFLFYQLGRGTYLRSTAVMTYDLEHSTYDVPIGLGVGQVIPRKKVIYNLFIEPQVSVSDKERPWLAEMAGLPRLQHAVQVRFWWWA
jgi:hypothetical protein